MSQRSTRSKSKNKLLIQHSPSLPRWRPNSKQKSPVATQERCVLRAGLDSDEENSSRHSSPPPFISRNVSDINDISVLDDSLNTDHEDEGILTGSFYSKSNSDFFDLVAKKKAENELVSEINERLSELKNSVKKKSVVKTKRTTYKRKSSKKVETVSKKPKMEQTCKQEIDFTIINSDNSNVSINSASKRKFFSPRSPSKIRRSTLMIGNKKVQFDAVKKKEKPKIERPDIVKSSLEKECEMFVTSPTDVACSEEMLENKIDETLNISEEMLLQCTDENIFEGAQVEVETEENLPKTKIDSINSKPLYPLFLRQQNRPESLNSSKTSIKKTPNKKKRFKPSKNDKMEQLVIDVGQKEVAPVQCPLCAMIYTPCDANDEALHNSYHNNRVKRLAFPGWKTERVVQCFDDGRIILVLPTDPHYMLQKLNDVWEELNVELGEIALKKNTNIKYYLFITNDKKIVGLLASETVRKAYRLIPDEKGSLGNCEQTPEPVVCGVYRLWTLATYRKQKIATRLLDCLRNNFVYAYVMSISDLAFSSPTQDGAKFLSHYTGTDSFLVYK